MSARRSGFTLIELMAAMLLGAIVMLMVVSTVRTTVTLAGGSHVDEQRGKRSERGRQFLARQISWVALDRSREPRRFVAQAGALEFETMVSIERPEHGRRVLARYDIVEDAEAESVSLVYREVLLASREQDDPEPAPDPLDAQRVDRTQDLMLQRAEAHIVMEDLQRIQIEYLTYREGSATAWSIGWAREMLPRAVRVTWTTKEGEAGRWVIPVEATF